MNAILDLLGAHRYIPHAVCMTNDAVVMFLSVFADMSTFLAYTVIGLSVIFFGMQRPAHIRPELKLLVGTLILLCGISRLVLLLTMYVAVYRLDVFIRAAIAGMSVVTAIIIVGDVVKTRIARRRG